MNIIILSSLLLIALVQPIAAATLQPAIAGGHKSDPKPTNKAGVDIRTAINGLPGAIGDGDKSNAARNAAAINAHILAVSAQGGGNVIVPKGWFKTSAPIEVRDNVHLIGAGYESHIDNISTSGFAKNTLITGNIGDIGGKNGLYYEAKYDLKAITSGAVSVTFATARDASTFSVGDIVGIMSSEIQPTDKRYPVYNDLNVVTAKNGATLSLRYAIGDTYSSVSGNPKIARFSGAVKGYDHAPLWMAQNASVENIRLTNATGLGSGWYALFACGVGNTYKNIWIDNASAVIGSNGLSHSSISDVSGGFDLRGIDMADFQVANTLDNITITRIGVNPLLRKSSMGIGIYSGSDITVNHLSVDLGGNGQVSMVYINRGKYTNFKVKNAGAGVNVGILSGYGTDMEISNGILDGSDRHGIYVVGNRAKITGNKISNTGKTGAFPSIGIRAGVVDYIVENNVCGISGARTANDTVKTYAVSGAAGIIRNNTTFKAK